MQSSISAKGSKGRSPDSALPETSKVLSFDHPFIVAGTEPKSRFLLTSKFVSDTHAPIALGSVPTKLALLSCTLAIQDDESRNGERAVVFFVHTYDPLFSSQLQVPLQAL